jgi:hypothetical protein
MRTTKENGYKTGPFDMMISNYIGLIECIKDDFKYFCDPNYLELRKCPIISPHIPNQNDEEFWIYNTKYNFAFNHEAPGHGGLYLSERWIGGIDHFVVNNFENFINRYTNRINNFRTYLEESDYINFILYRYNSIPYELVDVIKEKYPNLKFRINTIINFGPHTVNCLINRTVEAGIKYEMYYHSYMLDEEKYPNEFSRYTNDYSFNYIDSDYFELNENIILIDPLKSNKLF